MDRHYSERGPKGHRQIAGTGKADAGPVDDGNGRTGPVRGNWPNYGKLGPGRHHCHLKKGHPTYVAVWEESPEGIKLIEVTYAGTHERAPY